MVHKKTKTDTRSFEDIPSGNQGLLKLCTRLVNLRHKRLELHNFLKTERIRLYNLSREIEQTNLFIEEKVSKM